MSDGPGRGDPGDDGAGVGGGFDVAHLQSVHRHLFDGVDPEAGRLRTVDPPAAPGPGNPPDGEVVMAVPARHIRTAGGKVLDVLDRAGLRGLATGTVAAVLAELYVDLRVLRPFQTGNDEAIRVFLGLLADDAGYRIDWPAVPPAALTAACDTGDPDPLRVVLQGAVHHIDPTGRGAGRRRREVHACRWSR
jgi:cell filamentation protein